LVIPARFERATPRLGIWGSSLNSPAPHPPTRG